MSMSFMVDEDEDEEDDAADFFAPFSWKKNCSVNVFCHHRQREY